jgi:hypothetical protein
MISGMHRVGYGLLLATLLPFEAFAAEGDEAAIREVQARQAAAWNAHDAVAYANLFTDDGDVVNVLGWWWRGRSTIQSKLSDAFAWVEGIQIQVLRETGGQWLIASFQNTNSVPESPFPKGPPSAPR